jgi:hypothetical protein
MGLLMLMGLIVLFCRPAVVNWVVIICGGKVLPQTWIEPYFRGRLGPLTLRNCGFFPRIERLSEDFLLVKKLRTVRLSPCPDTE